MVKSSGFTLVELLIVIAVIGILAGGIISIVNPVAQFQKAQDSRRKSDLSQIQKAFETFYQDNGKYPDAIDYKIKSLSDNNADNNAVEWGGPWLPYMGTLPKDPSSSKNYVYYSPVTSNGQTYYIYASLDREGNDPQACHLDGTRCDNAPVAASCGAGAVCNYGISSPNVSP